MSVAVFITNENDASSMIPWGVRFAQADHRDLLVIVPRKSKGRRGWEDVYRASDTQSDNPIRRSIFAAIDALPQEHVSLAAPPENQADSVNVEIEGESAPRQPLLRDEKTSRADDHVEIKIREIIAPTPASAFVDEVDALGITLMIIPAHEPTKTHQATDNWLARLLHSAHCETMILRGKSPPANKNLRVLVATQGEADVETALQRAVPLVGKSAGNVSILFVRPDDDEVAEQVASLQLDRLSRGVAMSIEDMPKTVVLNDSFRAAIQQHCAQQDDSYDIVLVGTRSRKTIKQLLRRFESTGEKIGAIAAVRRGTALTSRLWISVRTWFRSRVPQINRERRVSLVDLLHSSSSFNFDFIALISLSTLIAALGLIRNSGSVVIGAMLIAPLMTPLAGTGFALVQGNARLIRNALKAVLFGFAVAFVIAFATGFLVPGIEIKSEMTDRGSPHLLDLLVALVSGIAAAYAMGRPNLLSALPGVAIAAALVPPIATSGIALAHPDFGLWIWSLLLFFTNIVAIILGTAITFWAVGIDSRSETKKREGRAGRIWPRIWFITFVIISVILATIMTIRHGI